MDFKHVILPKVNRTENLQIMGVKLILECYVMISFIVKTDR